MLARLRSAKLPLTGTSNLNGVVAGTTVGGPALRTSEIETGSLSCRVTVLAETNTLTLTFKWQVSDDATTWVDLAPANNAANVVLATGTAGADAAVSRVFGAPEGAVSWNFVRPALVTGVVTGASADTYAFDAHYRQEAFNL